MSTYPHYSKAGSSRKKHKFDTKEGGSLDRLIYSRKKSDASQRLWKHSPGLTQGMQDLVPEDFTLADVDRFEKFITMTVELLSNSSEVKTGWKGSYGSKKTRIHKKKQIWQAFEEIQTKVPGILMCLKNHTNHQNCSDLLEGTVDVTAKPPPQKSAPIASVVDGEQLSNQELRKELEKKKEQILNLEKTLQEYSKKLASEMGKKVSADESSLENISIKNRPMTTADEYLEVQSNQWLDAKTVLDERCPMSSESAKLTLLCDVIGASKKAANALCNTVMENVQRGMIKFCAPHHLYFNNKGQVPRRGNKKRKSQKRQARQKDQQPVLNQNTFTLPTEVINIVGDYLRKTCNDANLEGMCQEAMQILEEHKYGYKSFQEKSIQKHWNTIKKTKEFQTYLQAVCRLTWKMSIQRPRMILDFAAERKTEREQDLHWNSQIEADAQVCVVFPVLTHGNQVMAKGKVYLYVP